MQDFLDKLSDIEQKYKTEKETINIFNILFKGHEEVELHSRFISYLLSSNSIFLNSFVEMLGITDFDMTNCEVFPNEQNKSELWEIDILIINKENKQAVIIENKIHATDSIHFDDDNEINKKAKTEKGIENCSYKGQLERYYHTITKGIYKKGNEYKPLEDKSFICNKVHLYYLSLYKEPSKETIGKLDFEVFNPEKHKISYHKIQDWLAECLKKGGNEFLKTIIQQYLNLITKMINDDKTARELTDLISKNDNWKNAMCLQNNFIHIKWHTIHRLFTELAESLNAKVPSGEEISEVAHKNKKNPLVLVFNYEGTELQIINDEKGFTLRNPKTEKWNDFSGELKNIKFCDFSSEETFRIINNECRKKIIDEIIDKIPTLCHTLA